MTYHGRSGEETVEVVVSIVTELVDEHGTVFAEDKIFRNEEGPAT